VNRILRDDPSKGDMNNRQAITLDRLWKCLKDYDLWPLYLVGLTTYIPPQPPQNYLSFILRQMGFSTFQANLLTIPSQFMFGVFVSFAPVHSLPRASANCLVAHHFLHLRKTQRTLSRLQHVKRLDPSLDCRPSRPRK
jgi:hypothetical protein